jgi:CRP-like cAMP-binding protein
VQQTTQPIKEWLDRLYRRTFRPQLDAATQQTADVLRSVPLFSEFSRSAIRHLAESLHAREYKRDEYIYRERDPSLGMYIIDKGRVRLSTEDEEGNLHEAKQVGDLDLFGELALLGDFRRQETAQAVTETRVLGFFRPELKAMIKRDPKTAAELLNAMAGHVAARHVAFCSLLAEKEGKLVVMRMLDVASMDAGGPGSTTSFHVRP